MFAVVLLVPSKILPPCHSYTSHGPTNRVSCFSACSAMSSVPFFFLLRHWLSCLSHIHRGHSTALSGVILSTMYLFQWDSNYFSSTCIKSFSSEQHFCNTHHHIVVTYLLSTNSSTSKKSSASCSISGCMFNSACNLQNKTCQQWLSSMLPTCHQKHFYYKLHDDYFANKAIHNCIAIASM